MSNNRTALQSALAELIDGARANGAVIDVAEASARLARTYPESGLSLAGIAREIEDAAVRAGVVLFAGSRPPG